MERSLADLTSDQPQDGIPLADIARVYSLMPPRYLTETLPGLPPGSNGDDLRNYTSSPSEAAGDLLQRGLMGLGVNTYSARHLGKGFRDVAQLTPLGIPMGLADLEYYSRKGDIGNAALAAISVIPPMGMAGKGLRVSRGSPLPMDEASRMARAREMGTDPLAR